MFAKIHGLVNKAFSRPGHTIGFIREKFLFLRTRLLVKVPFIFNSKISLGKNVRLQSLSSLMAERPKATISIGNDCIIYEDARINAYGDGRIEIGQGSIIGRALIFSKEKIRIGEHVVMSWDVFIQDYDPHPINPRLRKSQTELMIKKFQPRFNDMNKKDLQSEILRLESTMSNWKAPQEEIVIGNNVWLGASVTILKGARIGDGCVVGAQSVVRKGEYPAGSLIAGSPARVIKSLLAPE